MTKTLETTKQGMFDVFVNKLKLFGQDSTR